MDPMLETAFLTAIEIENRSLSFYHALSSKVTDIRTRRIFEQMAKEEQEHLESFCNLYPGNHAELIDLLFKSNMYLDPYYCTLLNSIDEDGDEIKALEISLKEEQACIEKYTVFAETVRDPHVRNVFVHILNETHKHREQIEEEYMRHMEMPDRAVQDSFVRE